MNTIDKLINTKLSIDEIHKNIDAKLTKQFGKKLTGYQSAEFDGQAVWKITEPKGDNDEYHYLQLTDEDTLALVKRHTNKNDEYVNDFIKEADLESNAEVEHVIKSAVKLNSKLQYVSEATTDKFVDKIPEYMSDEDVIKNSVVDEETNDKLILADAPLFFNMFRVQAFDGYTTNTSFSTSLIEKIYQRYLDLISKEFKCSIDDCADDHFQNELYALIYRSML